MNQIDMQRLRDALPKRGTIKLAFKTNSNGTRSLYFECIVRFPGLYDKGTNEEEKVWEEVKKWQREIIGKENISEFYTEETGSHWYVYLKRVPLEFINCTDEDIKTYTGFATGQLLGR
jgi:hypothetical protein